MVGMLSGGGTEMVVVLAGEILLGAGGGHMRMKRETMRERVWHILCWEVGDGHGGVFLSGMGRERVQLSNQNLKDSRATAKRITVSSIFRIRPYLVFGGDRRLVRIRANP